MMSNISNRVDEIIGLENTKSVREMQVDNVLIVRSMMQTNFDSGKPESLRVVVLDKKTETENEFTTENKDNISFNDRIKKILIEAIKYKLLEQDARVLFYFDKSCGFDFQFGSLLIEVSRVLYRIGRFDLGEYMENDAVISKVIELAEQIRNEGREGKKVGTLFVIGDLQELNPYLKPLIMNPFYGYPENFRNILTSDLTDTIKEFSQLDGSFVISNEGIIVSAGTYLDVDTTEVKRCMGWGTRHLAAVAITTKTKAVAVLVSSSGNLVKVFKNGKLIVKF